MKNRKFIYLKNSIILSLLLVMTTACEREVSDQVEFATFPKNPEVFIDGFSAGLEYLPFGDSKLDAFSVDTETKYEGTASMRVDVPNQGDGYAGAIFPDMGGRDLSDYDALTFWAKATKAATINEIGFGNDFGENKYLVTKQNLRISTTWTKYVIPIPDPFKLTIEKGLFWYAEPPEDPDGDEGPLEADGYTFWIDELKFEKLGTVAQPQPAIFGGEELQAPAYLDVTANIPRSGLTQTFNLASGGNQTVVAAPAYFTFNSSNPEIVSVSESGSFTPARRGTAKITASLAGVAASGSLEVTVTGPFNFAPLPPERDPLDVISIFSNAYNDVAIEYYNGFFLDGFQTTLGGNDLNVNGDEIIRYTELNFVAIKSLNTVDASAMTHFHVDIQVSDSQVDSGDFMEFILLSAGADGILGTGDDNQAAVRYDSSNLVAGDWASFDVPLADFTGLDTSNLILYFFNTEGTIEEILVDNIYFYRD